MKGFRSHHRPPSLDFSWPTSATLHSNKLMHRSKRALGSIIKSAASHDALCRSSHGSSGSRDQPFDPAYRRIGIEEGNHCGFQCLSISTPKRRDRNDDITPVIESDR